MANGLLRHAASSFAQPTMRTAVPRTDALAAATGNVVASPRQGSDGWSSGVEGGSVDARVQQEWVASRGWTGAGSSIGGNRAMPPHGPGHMPPKGPSQHVQVRRRSVYLRFGLRLRRKRRSLSFGLNIWLCVRSAVAAPTFGRAENVERWSGSKETSSCCSCWR